MKQFFQHKGISIACHLLLAIAVLPFVVMLNKTETLMQINGHHSDTLDFIFYHITRLPELSLIVFVIILSAFYERKILIATLIAMSLCGISILIFKNFIFSDFDRPFKWLSDHHIPFHEVPGIRLHANGSFPSGHTMSPFCALGIAGLISRNGFIQFIFFIFKVPIQHQQQIVW